MAKRAGLFLRWPVMLKVGLCKFEFFKVSQNINSNYKRKNDVFAATTDTEA